MSCIEGRLEAEKHLMPCPFCGNKSVDLSYRYEYEHIDGSSRSREYNIYGVQCDVCTMTFGEFLSLEECVIKWNTRVST